MRVVICLVWDATVVDSILCPGHGSDGRRGGRDFHGEKKRKVQRSLKHARLRSSGYGDLRSSQRHRPELSARPIGRKLTTSTGDKRETCFLLQRLSVTIQRVNSVAFHGTLPEPDLREPQL